jgi:hypothetical protein
MVSDYARYAYDKANEHKSIRQMARELGINDRTLRRHMVKYADVAPDQEDVAVDIEAEYEPLPDRIPLDYLEGVKVGLVEKPIYLEIYSMAEPVGVCADLHAPLFDPAWVNDMIDAHSRIGVRKLLILGDFAHMDKLGQHYPKQSNIPYETEYTVNRALMGFLLRHYEEVYMIRGNHDVRIRRRTNYKMSFSQSMYALFEDVPGVERLTISNLDHLRVTDYSALDDTATDWYMCHPPSYSTIPMAHAIKLAGIHNTNIVTAHSHHAAKGFAKDGVTQVIEIGGLFDRDRTEYLQESTAYPVWVNGYGAMVDGQFKMNTPAWREI